MTTLFFVFAFFLLSFVGTRVVLWDLFQRGQTLSLWRNHLFFRCRNDPRKVERSEDARARGCSIKQDAWRERASENEYNYTMIIKVVD